MNLQDCFEQYLDERELKDSTRYKYRNNIKYLGKLAKRKVDKISPKDVVLWFDNLKARVGHSLSHQVVRDAKAVVNYSKQCGYVASNPFNVLRLLNKLRPPKIARERDLRTDWSVWLRGVLDIRLDAERDLILFLALTGGRILEARMLRWEDVDLTHGSWIVPDIITRVPIVLPLSSFVCQLLSQRKILNPNSQYVFEGTKAGKPLCGQMRAYREFCDRAGFDSNVSSIRKSIVCFMVAELNFPENITKGLMNRGITSPEYYKTDPERLRPYVETLSKQFLKAAKFSFEPTRKLSIHAENSKSSAVLMDGGWSMSVVDCLEEKPISRSRKYV